MLPKDQARIENCSFVMTIYVIDDHMRMVFLEQAVDFSGWKSKWDTFKWSREESLLRSLAVKGRKKETEAEVRKVIFCFLCFVFFMGETWACLNAE